MFQLCDGTKLKLLPFWLLFSRKTRPRKSLKSSWPTTRWILSDTSRPFSGAQAKLAVPFGRKKLRETPCGPVCLIVECSAPTTSCMDSLSDSGRP